MKKAKKVKTMLGTEITLVYDKRLDGLKVSELAPRKLAEANERLKKFKSFPR